MPAPQLVESRPAKRSRDDIDQEPIVEHDSLYFKDGDIVLLSLPCDGIVTAFKVDKVYLLRSSLVFAGMLSLPSPEDVEKYDHVPLVRLQDEAKHLASFLKALYDPRDIPMKKHDRGTTNQIEGMLILSSKYQVDYLRERIVASLSADWPGDLRSWDLNEGEFETLWNYHNDADEPVDDYLPEPCSVIRLARNCGIPRLLPATFYHLSRIPPKADKSLSDNFTVENHDDFMSYLHEGGRTASFALLSSEDLICLARGIQSITEFFDEICLDARHDALYSRYHDEGQQQRLVCSKALASFTTELELKVARKHDPLDVMRHVYGIRSTEACSHCKLRFTSKLVERREEMWARLPDFFKLPKGTA